MKAIQCRYLPATNKKDIRLKVWAHECKPLTVTRDYSKETSEQVEQVITDYATTHTWLTCHRVVVGQLPNGDYAGVLVHS